jgi:electron transport complex protein RnfD
VFKEDRKAIFASDAPHIRDGSSVKKIMWTVVLALLPAIIYSIYIFGLRTLYLYIASVLAALIAETLMRVLLKKKVTSLDGSAVITGILVAMNVPPASPVWMSVIGSVFAIVIVKQLFGGLGFNIFNPALAARAFMLASWPAYMTTGWTVFDNGHVISQTSLSAPAFPKEVFDVMTHATPLTALKEGAIILADYNVKIEDFCVFLFSPEMLWSQVKGNIGGCVGVTSALLLLAGGLILLVRRVITWHIPAAYITSVAVLAFVYYSLLGYPQPQMITLFHILTGGLILGAFFMATDMVTSPVSRKGMLLFGAGCGIITFVIRIWGGFPEGVSYSILLMNAATPLIDRFTKPKVFGRLK